MKTFCILLIAIFFFTNANAQKINLDWAHSMGSNNYDEGNSIKQDGFGNSITVGVFYDEFSTGNPATTVTSNGLSDIFVQKRDQNGDLVWLKSFGGIFSDNYIFIDIDTIGDILITGEFRDTIYFNQDETPDTLISHGQRDIFVMKIDSDGGFLWAKAIGGLYDDKGESIALDNEGNILISGVFRLTVDFNPGSGIFELSSNGQSDYFILKLNNNGDFVWAKSIGGSGNEGHSIVDVNSINEILLFGQFLNTVDFDPGIEEYELTSNGYLDVFILKLSSDGDFSWVESIGNSFSLYTNSLAIDESDNILLAGSFNDTVDFDPGIEEFNLVSDALWSQTNPFILKLTNEGNFIWANAIQGSDGFSEIYSISSDYEGNIIIGGWFDGTVDFDPSEEEYNATAISYGDGFVMKLNGLGDFKWVSLLIGDESSFSSVNSVSPLSSEKFLLTGFFDGTIDSDPSDETYTLISNGNEDIFIQQISESNVCSDLFFSEYIEGSSSNKAFELYNPSNSPIDLSDYVVYRNNNGSLTPTDSLFPFGIIESNDIYIVANPSANSSILAESDTLHTMTFYNGDDALWLKKISTSDTLDIIGEIGIDPGSGWTVGTGATNNFTLIRNIDIQEGSSDWSTGALEWDVFPIDMTDSLGLHTMTSCIECIPQNNTLTVSACNSYTSPSGNFIWTSSNTYSDTLVTSEGCDSILSIELTVYESTSSTISVSECDSYTSPSGNYIWTSSNTYLDTLTNIAGCDSIVSIDLTILESNGSTISVSACDFYTSPSGNEIWSSSGTYSDTLLNINGCDSVITINLSIISSSVSTITVSACNFYDSPSGNYTWTSSGSYSDTLINSLGCDSILSIDLQINIVDVSITVSGPSLSVNTESDYYQWLDCDNNNAPIEGETSQIYTATSNGNYAVIIEQNNCVDTSACITITSVGIQENALFNNVKVYPNPNQGHVHINLGDLQNISIKVYNTNRQLLYTEENINNEIHEFDLNVSPGMYSVEVSINEEMKIFKLIIE